MRRDGTLTTTLEIVVSPEDDAEVRRISITNHGTARARDRAHLLCRDSRWRGRPTTWRIPPSPNCSWRPSSCRSLGALLATRRRRSAADPQVWAAHLAVVEGEGVGRRAVRNRPRPLPRPRPDDPHAGGDRRRLAALEHRRRGARSDLQPAPARAHPARRHGAHLVLDDGGSVARRGARPRRQASRRAGLRARGDAGLDPGADAAAPSGHRRRRRASLPAPRQSRPLFRSARCGPPPDVLRARQPQGLDACGRTASPATCPSCWCASSEDDDLTLVRQLLRAHEYWRLKQLAVDLVILNERAASYAQDLQQSLDALVRTNQSMPRLAGDEVHGAGLRAARRSDPGGGARRCCSPRRAPCCTGGAARSPSSSTARATRKPGTRRRRVAPSRPAMPDVPLPRPQLEFFNGLGGFARRRPRICDRPRRRPAHAGALDQRHRQPAISAFRSRPTAAASPGRSTASRTSSRRGRTIRSATRPARRSISATRTPASCGRRRRCRSARRPRATSRATARATAASSTPRTASRSSCRSSCRSDDPIKISRLKIANRSGRGAAALGHRLCRMGARRDPRRDGAVHRRPRSIRRPARSSRATRGTIEFGDARRLRRPARPADAPGPATAREFLGRNGTLDTPAGARARRSRCPTASAPGSIPAARCRRRSDSAPAAATEIRLLARPGRDAGREAEALVAKYRTADLDAVLRRTSTQHWDDTLGTVQVKTPDRALDILLNRWLLYQTLALPHLGARRLLPGERRLWLPRPVAGRDGAVRARGPISRASICCAPPGGSSPKATCSIGGCRKPARGIRTRISDDRVWLAYVVGALCRRHRRRRRARRDGAVPRRPGAARRRARRVLPAGDLANRAPACSSIARWRSTSQPRGRRARPAADGHRRLERRHEPRRRAAARARASGSAGSSITTLDALRALSPRRAARRERAAEWRAARGRRCKARSKRQAWDGDWYRRAYFDDGTPLGSVANSECRIDSIAQSWAVISGARRAGARRARHGGGRQISGAPRREAGAAVHAALRASRATIPATSRAIRRASARTAGNTPMPRLWAAHRFRDAGRRRQGGRAASRCSIPIHHADDPTGMQRYQVEPYVVCGRRLFRAAACRARRLDLVHGLGRLDVPRSRSNGCWASACRASNLVIDPCIPHAWPGFEITFRYRSSTYRDLGRQSARRVPRHPRRQARRQDARRRPALVHSLAGRREDAPAFGGTGVDLKAV